MSVQKNQLNNQASAYLRQHGQDPVNWMVWSEETIQKVKQDNRPVFISIGYSTCHWCHVMAKESFSDKDTAEILNEKFNSIKIDREEMPEVDQYFQKLSMLSNGRGGWPLSIFLTPDLKLISIGTYFPKVASNGLPGFNQVLQTITDFFKNKIQDIHQQDEIIQKHFNKTLVFDEAIQYQGEFPHPQAIIKAVEQIRDKEWGGYGSAPKFPNFAFHEFYIEQALEGMLDEQQVRNLVSDVEKMFMGGIYDHAKGGVHRYATDREWKIPHFEKMLYDQCGMLKLLSKIAVIAPTPLFFDGIIQTLDYLETEMLHEKKYFMAAQDADSEGVEGLFFCFTQDEFNQAVIDFDSQLEEKLPTLHKWFDIKTNGNFNNMNTITLSPQFRSEYFTPDGWNIVRSVRQALRESRRLRMPPMTDNKGIAGWNFMMVSALIDIIQYSKIDVIREKSLRLLELTTEGLFQTFLKTNQIEDRNIILHTTTRDDLPSQFEDYVYFAEAQIRLYEISTNHVFFDNAIKSIDFILRQFFKDGLFYAQAQNEAAVAQMNIAIEPLDQGYKNAIGTFISMVKKLNLIPQYQGFYQHIQPTLERYKQFALHHPLHCGELLRGLIYPLDSYKLLKIPVSWYTNPEYSNLLKHFSARFLITYHGEQYWQICNHSSCEHQGETLESFRALFINEADS
jgi:uncharacterized protein